MLDRHRPAGHALQRVQHDEADAVGQEIARRAAFRPKRQLPGRQPFDARIIGKAGIAAAFRPVADAEALRLLLDRQIENFDGRRSPFDVAQQERYAADHLDAVAADVAQIAGIEHRRQPARLERPRRSDLLFRPKKCQRACRHESLRLAFSSAS